MAIAKKSLLSNAVNADASGFVGEARDYDPLLELSVSACSAKQRTTRKSSIASVPRSLTG